MYVAVGNANAIEAHRDGDDSPLYYTPIDGEHTTIVTIPDGYSVSESFATAITGISQGMAEGAKPIWIESNSDNLLAMLLDHYELTKTAGKRPKGWGDPEYPVAVTNEDGTQETKPKSAVKRVAKKAVAKKATTGTSLMLVFYAFLLFAMTRMALRTSAGRDWQCRIMGDPSANGGGIYAAGSWMGLTADATTPNVASTILTGEITTGTLARKQCAYSHTNGTASYALIGAFTSDQVVRIAKLGIFYGPTGGPPVFETMLNQPAEMVIGDVTTITETVTL